MDMRKSSILILMASMSLTSAAFAQSDVDKLHKLFDEREAWLRAEFPQFARSKGDDSHADHLASMSLAAIEKRQDVTKSHLDRLRAIDRRALPDNDQVNYDLFELELNNAVEG